jgi:SAM-dependent methyltransferase
MNLRHFVSRNWWKPASLEEQLVRMRKDWDHRAASNPLYFIATSNENWTDEAFYASGEQTVKAYILSDIENICQGQDPKRMRVLEIGCGAGRETRSLARFFGEVHAVDISEEMVRLARAAVIGLPNAFVYQNNGMDLSVIGGEEPFDFAYSYLVFQHIPCREVIHSYAREVHRLLRPGALFKFQLQGIGTSARRSNTWFGAPFSEEQVRRMASVCGFESHYCTGVGEQYFWNWFFKPQIHI